MTDKRVVIITGVSSGIGLAAAQLFTARAWIVVGTVRSKDYPAELSTCGVDVQMAEMTSERDIERVVKQSYKTYGRIDAVVANAGYGLLGPLDSLTHEQIVSQLAVNTVAVADLARLAIPIMKTQGYGVIAAVSSVAGRVGIPGYSAYNASKFAIEGLFEALAVELAGTGIAIKLIEPSTVTTAFFGRSAKFGRRSSDYASKVVAKTVQQGIGVLSSSTVADIIYRAVTNQNAKLHFPVGLTQPIVLAKRFMPDAWFRRILRRFL